MEDYKEQTRIPKFILVFFIIQFVFFLFYIEKDNYKLYYIIGVSLIGILLYISKLTLKLSKRGIQYHFFPFFVNDIKWSEVCECDIIKIDPISDFLGWGVKYSKKYGKGYIMGNSNYAILIKTKKGKKVTISIQDKELIKEAVSNYTEFNFNCS